MLASSLTPPNQLLTAPKLAQTSVALINLTYNLNDGTDWNGTYTRDGIVNASNLACYFGNPHKKCPSEPDLIQGRANTYGRAPPISTLGYYDEIQDVYKSRYNYGYYCRRTLGECAYRFVEYNPDDQQKTYPILTNRLITASADQCFTYMPTESPRPAKDTSGDMEALNFTVFNGSVHEQLVIPKQSGGTGATTYIYRGIRTPQEATKVRCGDRCVWMWAHKSGGKDENSTFYKCSINISDVTNTNNDTRKNVPNDVARLAASAIALQGRWAKKPDSDEKIWTQFQFYPFG